MRTFRKLVYVMVMLLVITSCTSVNISSIKNYEKKISEVSGILVFSDMVDMELRLSLEKEIVNQFVLNGKYAKESILLFPPIKDYSVSELKEKCELERITARLKISPISSSTETGFMYMYGTLVPVSSTDYSFDMILQDLSDDAIILRSTVSVADGGSIKSVIDDVAKKIVAEIIAEGRKEKWQY